ncbi:hypothetical protein CPLU01_05018 [Colletotrichum plurivorum]|uniref:Uncharacterized protein n=1 Tax=Colletotrichum plurivorum TaxID=2175906 RepID=A0A8H6KMR2_9PEZI|nr:hypothetical protein CPLU01_05018 [Colletotrichum plurivorum]
MPCINEPAMQGSASASSRILGASGGWDKEGPSCTKVACLSTHNHRRGSRILAGGNVEVPQLKTPEALRSSSLPKGEMKAMNSSGVSL